MTTIGSLFSGIGGLELGLERAGLGRTAWQVEIDSFCRSLLAKHWPGVTQHDEVRSVGAHNLSPVDLICGGFPCQDVSSAGARAGLSGAKSGLWYEYLRIVTELRPRCVIVENVTSGKKLWLKTVREGLGSLGYGTRAFALSAADVGAPHLRRRVFVIATDPNGIDLWEQSGRRQRASGQGASFASSDGRAWLAATDADRAQREGDGSAGGVAPEHDPSGHDGLSRHAGDPYRDGESAFALDVEVAGVRGLASDSPPWAAAPLFCGVDDGLPGRVDRSRSRRLKALGNAVVPQCAEVIGRIVKEMCLL